MRARCGFGSAVMLAMIVGTSCSRVSEATTDLELLSTTSAESTTTIETTSTTVAPTTTSRPLLRPHDGPLVTTAGFGKVFFGMTTEEAEAALETALRIEDDSNRGCYEARPAGILGVTFIMAFGRVERVDVVAGPVTTRSGIGIGTPESVVLELLGDNMELTTTEVGNRLTFVPDDGSEFRVVFDTDGEEVVQFRSGRLPTVGFNDCR